MPLPVVAQSSDSQADTFYVATSRGAYPVVRPYLHPHFLCLIDQSRTCRHASAARVHYRHSHSLATSRA